MQDGRVPMTDSTIEHSSAAFGGAIYAQTGGSARLIATVFESNSATTSGDDIFRSGANDADAISCPSECPSGTFNGHCSEMADENNKCANCECYSCSCSYESPSPTTFTPFPTPPPTSNPTSIPPQSPSPVLTSRPSAWPTPGPTPAPTSLPTQQPTPTPTIIPSPEPTVTPTPAPTPTTEFTIAPQLLEVAAIKPSSALGTAYIANLNQETMFAVISLQRTTLPTIASWSVTPSNFSLAPGKYVQVAFTIDSAKLNPQIYNLTFDIAARTSNSPPILRSLPLGVTFRAKADAAMTQLEIRGAPTLDAPWAGVAISPFDVDGFPIFSDEKEDIDIALVHASSLSASCKVWWSTIAYTGECVVPDAGYAGEWKLTASLDQAVFYTGSVHARCRDRFYEEPTRGVCVLCPLPGSSCSQAGVTLATLPIGEGYWRTGEPRLLACLTLKIADLTPLPPHRRSHLGGRSLVHLWTRRVPGDRRLQRHRSLQTWIHRAPLLSMRARAFFGE